jgi:hypothetical protein
MKYYFILDRDPHSAKYMQAVTLHRWYQTNEGSSTEMWNGKKWENNPALIRVADIDKDNDYTETTEKQAVAFLMGHNVKGIADGAALKWDILPRSG